MSLSRALGGLQEALDKLERTVEAAAEEGERHASGRVEVQRLNADRASLAEELDAAEARAARLAESNREVSRRLVTAMETIRTVIERPGS